MLIRADASTGDTLRLLADGRPRTRAELAQATGLARSAIAAKLDLFFGLGLVVELDRAPSTGGRPSARLAFDPGVRSLLAIDLGAAHSTIAVTDLDGTVLAERRESVDIGSGPVAVLGHALDVCDELRTGAGDDLPPIAGVGVGVPGPVEHANGRPVRPPIMPGWDDFDIPAFVAARIDAPVLVDNDVNLLALGERSTRFPHADDLVYVKVSTGIGAGVISGGRLQRGALGAAGDIGHVQVPRAASVASAAASAHSAGIAAGAPTLTDGPDGELEAVASGAAVVRALAADGVEVHSIGELVDLIEAREPRSVEACRVAGLRIGEVLAICVSLLNPSVIVLGGSVGIASPEIADGVRAVVRARSLPLATGRLEVVTAEPSGSGGVRGAALMLRDHLFSERYVDVFLERMRAGR